MAKKIDYREMISDYSLTRKQAEVRFKNRIFKAKKYIYFFCRQNLIKTNGVKQHNLVYQYSLHIGKEIKPLTKNNCWKWLYDLYMSGEDELVKRQLNNGFYGLLEWKELRRKVLDTYGEKCMKCGSEDFIAVDHIKPRSLYPLLQLEFNNMQVLCRSCNSSKNNRNEKDYRITYVP